MISRIVNRSFVLVTLNLTINIQQKYVSMKQHIHLLDRRVGILSDFPNSSSIPIVNLIKLHSILYQEPIQVSDFKTTTTWSNQAIGMATIIGATRNSTGLQAIRQVCRECDLTLVEQENKKEEPKETFFTQLQFQNIPFTHYVTWKDMGKKLSDVQECFWRDRTWLSPADFVCVAERVNGYHDPSEWKIAVAHIESEQKIAFAVSEIAQKHLRKTFVSEPQNDFQSDWNVNASRNDITDDVWKSQHPYFKYVQYNPNGFIFLPKHTLQKLKPDQQKIYEAMLKNEMTRSLSNLWYQELSSHVKKQYHQFQQFNLDTSCFAQASQWTLPELLYFCVCPPRPIFPPNKQLDAVQQPIHQIIHFDFETKAFYITENKSYAKGHLIMYMKQDFADFFQCPNPIHDQNGFVFIVGMTEIVQFLQRISEQHLIPLPSLFRKPKVEKKEFVRLMMIKEATQLQKKNFNSL